MFILAFIIELIVNANWAHIPHAALVITGIIAGIEGLIYLFPLTLVLLALIGIVREK